MKISYRPGFTLVELNLSVTFVAILILGIALTTIHVAGMYQRGVTVKTVNQVGRDVFEQMRRDFANASPSLVNLTEVDQGRVCLGGASYVYNDAVVLNNGISDGIQDWTGEEVSLVRVADGSGEFCERVSPGGVFVRPIIAESDDSTELLESDAIPLAVHDFGASLFAGTDSGGLHQSLYRLQLTLGTNEADTTTEGAKITCKPPTDNQANFDSCFVSEFQTVVRSGEVSR